MIDEVNDASLLINLATFVITDLNSVPIIDQIYARVELLVQQDLLYDQELSLFLYIFCEKEINRNESLYRSVEHILQLISDEKITQCVWELNRIQFNEDLFKKILERLFKILKKNSKYKVKSTSLTKTDHDIYNMLSFVGNNKQYQCIARPILKDLLVYLKKHEIELFWDYQTDILANLPTKSREFREGVTTSIYQETIPYPIIEKMIKEYPADVEDMYKVLKDYNVI